METQTDRGCIWTEQMYHDFALYNGGLTKKYSNAIHALDTSIQDENIRRLKKQEIKDYFSEEIYPKWRAKANIGKGFPISAPDWSRVARFLRQPENEKAVAIRAWENDTSDRLHRSQKWHLFYYEGIVFN